MSFVLKTMVCLATQFGHAALKLVVEGTWNRLVAMQNGRITDVPIVEVADQQRFVPADHPLISAARAVGTSFGD